MNMSNRNHENEVRTFWNRRGRLGVQAGTNDINLKEIEIEAISRYIKDGMKVLDIGCGNGSTAIEMAKRYRVDITAFDYAEQMIAAAHENAAHETLKGNITFHLGNVKEIHYPGNTFDLVYTERVLINLRSWEEQREAIANILKLLVTEGLYLMCENSRDALDRLNVIRGHAGLDAMEPPWHNRYLHESEIQDGIFENADIIKIENFTSTYYFISRVIHAWQSKQEGKEPSYDSPLNKLALQLPPFGDVGQTKMWVWQKI